jgi:hypothetical protein
VPEGASPGKRNSRGLSAKSAAEAKAVPEEPSTEKRNWREPVAGKELVSEELSPREQDSCEPPAQSTARREPAQEAAGQSAVFSNETFRGTASPAFGSAASKSSALRGRCLQKTSKKGLSTLKKF